MPQTRRLDDLPEHQFAAHVAVPALIDVVKDRAVLKGLPLQVLAGLVVQLGAVQQDLGAAIACAQIAPAAPEPDRLITIDEAAQQLGVSYNTMQTWLRRPPYDAAVVVRSRTLVRVSAQRLQDILLSGGPRARRKVVQG
jgi:hypothetical protein